MPDLVRWLVGATSGTDAAANLQQVIRDRFGVRHCEITSTGRAGLTLLVRALHRVGGCDRDEVVVPSYTCYSVAASIVKAGLRPRIVDIDEQTLDYAPAALAATDLTRVLAVIATNLYGLPNDVDALIKIARPRGIFVIDDAAQSMGATVHGVACGTRGDAGLFSFDRGKNVSAVEGGVVVTNSIDIAAALTHEMASLPRLGAVASGLNAVKALAYSALLRPRLYWIPARLPHLQLGKTVFDTAFPLHRPSWPFVSLASTMMERLPEFTATRRRNATDLRTRIHALPGVQLPRAAADSEAAFLRFPVLMPTEAARDNAIASLTGAGIGATGSYPLSLGQVPELQGRICMAAEGTPVGRSVAARILTLPTHPYVTRRDIELSAEILERVLR